MLTGKWPPWVTHYHYYCSTAKWKWMSKMGWHSVATGRTSY